MLADRDIAKLCHGRIIFADVYNSSGFDAAGGHWAVMLDSDEDIAANDTYFVAPISTKLIDPEFIVAIPARTGLKGNVICSWLAEVALPGIQRVRSTVLTDAEMLPITAMLAKYRASRRSTQS